MKQILIAWMSCCIFCMWAFVLALAAMPAGQRVIKGIVTDAQTKESLIGASVTVKDLHTGSITGLDGSYRIGGLLSGCLPRGSSHSYGGGQCRSESGI